jgi:serine/threonine protein kinase
MPTLALWCEHKQSGTCGKFPERAYLCMPYAQADFGVDFWHQEKISLRTKMKLLQDTLRGIQKLHSLGIMHRDMTRKNMLILTIDPPHAVICDFGKATREIRSTFTKIGPICTCAPEVWDKDGHAYSNKIDLWSWAYAIAEVVGFHCDHRSQISGSRIFQIHNTLRAHARRVSKDALLVELLKALLNPDYKQRPSASEALKHNCWKILELDEVPNADPMPESKRPKNQRMEYTGNEDTELIPTQELL